MQFQVPNDCIVYFYVGKFDKIDIERSDDIADEFI